MSPHAKKISLFIAIVLFAIAAGVFTFIYIKIHKNSALAQSAELAWQTENNQREEINSLDATLESIADEKTALDTHFAKSNDIVPFLDTIEKLGTAAKAQAEVTSVDPQKDGSLSVGIRAAGTFSSTYAFLQLLENSPYELDFTSLDFSQDSNTTDPNALVATTLGWTATFKVRLLTYMP